MLMLEGELTPKTEYMSFDFRREINSKTLYSGFRLVAPDKTRTYFVQ